MMILGVCPSANSAIWVLIDKGNNNVSEVGKIDYPATKDESQNLIDVLEYLKTFVVDKKVELVCVHKATGGLHGASGMRFKIEGVIQICCRIRGVGCSLVSVQIKKQHVKFEKENGNDISIVLGNGAVLSSQGKKDAALIAWLGA
ncbi:DUF3010 family protein [Desulfovibrio subterraneus]|uniref:DUF3010 domain-containing protein n=1 Tax=Desulfovibrio subterraneus TaxID=2718620 RepID=A0A7J0BKK4_9BACT|nr:DUF3010 family protein [Desulfovibrio subterraneus]GFM34226.1 hypothetical protein DSM101010T_25910 [Desulfovibrio subterraneus]